MKSIQTKKIDNLIHKVLKETLESKAEKLHKELEEDLGGMEDTHPNFRRIHT